MIRDGNGSWIRNFCIVNIFFFFNLNGDFIYFFFLLLNFLWIKNKIETMRNNHVPWKLLLLVRILVKIRSIGWIFCEIWNRDKFFVLFLFFFFFLDIVQIFVKFLSREIYSNSIYWLKKEYFINRNSLFFFLTKTKIIKSDKSFRSMDRKLWLNRDLTI